MSDLGNLFAPVLHAVCTACLLCLMSAAVGFGLWLGAHYASKLFPISADVRVNRKRSGAANSQS